jgi:hypothetical protein
MVSTNLPRAIAFIMLCTTLVAAQTFQYSRGWTNGRKRGDVLMLHPGPVGSLAGQTSDQRAAVAEAAALLEDACVLFYSILLPCPCLHGIVPAASEESLQRIRDILNARKPSAMPVSTQVRKNVFV